jgi:hypothetical protein
VAGYEIGDSIPVTVVFEMTPDPDASSKTYARPWDPASVPFDSPTAPSAPPAQLLPVPEISIQGLQMGVLSSQPSDVELMPFRPVVQMFDCADNKVCERVRFWVRQFVTCKKDANGVLEREVSISADFEYAVDALPDGQPDWHNASTPAIQVGIVPTADANQVQMPEGDLQPKASTVSPLIWYGFILGPLMMLPLLLDLARRVIKKLTASKGLSANGLFWEAVDAVIKSALASPGGQFKPQHYQQIHHLLRHHFGVAELQLDDALESLKAQKSALEDQVIESVFLLEENLYKRNGILKPSEHDELMSSLALIIPRD